MKKLLLIALLIFGCEELLDSTKHGCIDSQACNYDADATLDNNSCIYISDCAGVCGGEDTSCEGCNGIQNSELVLDDCGVCGGNNSTCADCAGTLYGSAVEDNCGTCDSNLSNDCIQDCDGTWGGSIVFDECGICGGNNSTCLDCANVANGNNVVDNCGTCDSDSSNDCILNYMVIKESSGMYCGTNYWEVWFATGEFRIISFEFEVEDTSINGEPCDNGVALVNGWVVNVEGSKVSGSVDVSPFGGNSLYEGLLVLLDLDGVPSGLSNIKVTDESGNIHELPYCSDGINCVGWDGDRIDIDAP